MRILLILLFPLTLSAQSNLVSSIDDLMKAEVAVNNFNGNILVAKAGKIVYQKAFGFRNYYSKQILDTASVFELASVSKQFTAMGILLLLEKGKLSLNDSLRQYFPELPYERITIHHLLTHTSGLPAYEAEMAAQWDPTKIAFNKDVIHFLSTARPPSRFSPGKKWEYSNTGYVLLASIIERVAGTSYQKFMDDSIFKPLNMHKTRIYNTRRSLKDTIANYAYGFVYDKMQQSYRLPDSVQNYEFVVYFDGIQGDGTVNTNLADLYKWDRALMQSKLISEATQNKMFFPHQIIDSAAKLFYGYGVMVGQNEMGKFLNHSGGWPGYRTDFVRYPDSDITIFVLSNNESNAPRIGRSLSYLAFNRTFVFPYIHKEIELDPSVLNRYVGKYNVPPQIELIIKDNKLFRRREGTADIELKPESNVKFFYANNTDTQIEFELDQTGKVTKAFFILNGLKREMQAVN